MEVYKTWLPWGSARDVFSIDGGGGISPGSVSSGN